MNNEHPLDSAAHVIERVTREATTAKLAIRKGDYLDAAPFVILRTDEGGEDACPIVDKLDAAHRKSGTVKLRDADSFVAYYLTHGNNAPVYALLEPAQFVAVLNDHTADRAGFRDYRAEFKISHSKEWLTWTKHNGAGAAFNSNESFALFLEDNSPDIVRPEPAQMLQVALNFRMSADVHYQSAIRLQDGFVDFCYANNVSADAKTSDGKKLRIHEIFTIELPVFDGINAAKYRVDARFRYRLREGKLSLWYELVRPHKVVEQAFKDLWAKIAKETKAPILHGSPE